MSRYYTGERKAFAGQTGFAQNAITTVAQRNTGEKALSNGVFVSLTTDGGVALPTAQSQSVYGVVAYSSITEVYPKDKIVPVATLKAGEGIWVQVASGQSLTRGDKVYSDTEGKAIKTATGNVLTPYVVLDVIGELVLIGLDNKGIK